ncbi:IS3 family transposase [Lentilactobacillus sunkii]|uniref:Transposase IS150 IS3 family protein n=1 Tax=Lentilactobacillus sunkii DSM 19904 TaxID=1423808 RepID=A0A0R1KQL2_9LACO|nr:IS3 family transposase [Lentilactobacillus sunkii]KRK85702.1 transposase IS150 IS3 family protein [Lentilactobacillus sunkii DSM 19904]
MKANIVSSLRSHYGFQELLTALKLPRATYYDRLKRNRRPDKYGSIKAFIKKLFYKTHETYGYRRIHDAALKHGFSYAEETIRRLMSDMGLKVSIYSKHTSQYHSYKGQIGKIAPNILKQKFTAKQPLTVLHTDVTQVRLYNGKWGYISAITDEASREVLAAAISDSPNKSLIQATLKQLAPHLRPGIHPILHSDQGWQYQVPDYQARLKHMNICQSMSRKGNCHDNAPIESFFNLMKRECLNRYQINNVTDLRHLVKQYIQWFNYERISRNKNGLTPVEYRNQVLAS